MLKACTTFEGLKGPNQTKINSTYMQLAVVTSYFLRIDNLLRKKRKITFKNIIPYE